MNILFVCGGTGGHINPALAVANYIKEHRPESKITFAGSPLGMEARLVKEAGYPFEEIKVKGFQRRLTWKNIKNNFKAAYYVTKAGARAKAIIKKVQPDIVVGTGGYVSAPIMAKAAQLGIKTVTHEQNAFPGMTTKYLVKRVDKVLLAFEQAKDRLPAGIDYVVTGNPVREEFIFADRAKARAKLGIGEDEVCVLSYGGSLGAKKINETISDFMVWHVKNNKKFKHIHSTGAHGKEWFPELLREKGIDASKEKNLDIREYIKDMADCCAAADIIICRAGAITLSEITVAGKTAILIPSPNVASNHQYYNALALVEKGAALMIEESELSGEVLIERVEELIKDKKKLKEYGENAYKMAIFDTNKRIYEEILNTLKSK